MLAPDSLVALINSHAEDSKEKADNLQRPAPGVPVSTDQGGYRAMD